MEFQQNEEPNDRQRNHGRSRIRQSEIIIRQRQRTQAAEREPEGIESVFALIAT